MNARLLGTPNEEVWPGVGKLPNWHEYPQWNVSPLSSVIPSLDADGIDLLEVSHLPCAFVLASCRG
jgi:cyclin-dependent kinase